MTIVFVTNVKRPKLIEINTLVSVVIHHRIVIVNRYFSIDSFESNFRLLSDDRWNDFDDSNSASGSSSSGRKKDFVELDGRWRSTNPSIIEEGFNKAEDIASKVKEMVLDQRRPSREYSPDIR